MTDVIDNDQGSATVVAAWGIAAFTVLVVFVSQFGAVVVARHRAQSAADLSALAAAAANLDGGDGCAVAGQVVSRQRIGARLTACTAEGDDVVITVALDVTLGRLGWHTATAAARAGPV